MSKDVKDVKDVEDTNIKNTDKNTDIKIKNNLDADLRLHFRTVKDGVEIVEAVHIPGKATVEIDEAIYKQLIGSKSVGKEIEEIEVPTDCEVKVGEEKKDLPRRYVTEKFQTGKSFTFNLLKKRIEDGDITIIKEDNINE